MKLFFFKNGTYIVAESYAQAALIYEQKYRHYPLEISCVAGVSTNGWGNGNNLLIIQETNK
jgi:hypothetical protein